MAIQTEPTRIQIPFADSGTKNVIPDTQPTPSASQAASWEDGFPSQCSLPLSAGGIPPARADFNGIFNAITQSERFTEEGGVWTWDATVDYAVNRVALGSDGKLYWSVAQSGPNVGGAQNPTTDNGTYWQAMPMDDANVVHKTGVETISGDKSFTGQLTLNMQGSNDFDIVLLDNPNGAMPNFNISSGVYVEQAGGNVIGKLETTAYATGATITRLFAANYSLSDHTSILCYCDSGGTKVVRPDGNGNHGLGQSDHRWGQIWSTSSTISTSDARLKTEPEFFPDEVLDAWGDVDFVQFKMRESVDKKGDAARFHSGLVAQQIETAFASKNLDAREYGFFCWDEWEEEPDVRDESGHTVQEGHPAGDMFSLRYEEALCMEAAYQRRRADRAEARLATLEERLAAIEAKLNA